MSENLYMGVIGRPIFQSLSPILHEAALEQVGQKGAYLRIATDSVEEGIGCAKEMGLLGLNVTSPFKSTTQSTIPIFEKDAFCSGAFNTISFKADTSALNTDIYGVLKSLGIDKSGAEKKTALVIGAGGAAKAAVYALKKAGCRVFICNRTIEKAQEIALWFGAYTIDKEGAADLLKVTDYLINTVFSTEEIVSLRHLQPYTLIVDAIYAKQTPFLRALSGNKNYVDGRTWLMHQGVKAFEIFTGYKLTESQFTEIKNKLVAAVHLQPTTISLVGMMGSGKSSVARSLALLLGKEGVNLDDVIEQQAGCSIATLIDNKGEETFRALESQCLANVLNKKPGVISCGGGIVLNENNRSLLSKNTAPIWLWATPEELINRLGRSNKRPLLQGHDVEIRVNQLLADRFYDYAKISELVVQTRYKSPMEVAKQIAFEVLNAF